MVYGTLATRVRIPAEAIIFFSPQLLRDSVVFGFESRVLGFDNPWHPDDLNLNPILQIKNPAL